MILGGEKARPAGTAPWNVGVYKTISNNHKLICGGSIISPRLVVSVAHCFWKKGMLSIISVHDDLYQIAVGKYSRNITIMDNEFTKIMNVKTVYLNVYYYGHDGNFADDIAIIQLRKIISFSLGVLPICIDWKDIHPIQNGANGKIVGWGKTKNDSIESPILLEASLPYIDHFSCRNMYTNGFEKYVTKDKFCAGSVSGQGVHNGDSGAGISFLHSNFYYLTGVASIKDPETDNSISVFTEVQHHIQWIRRLYDEYY